jgi:hypothetical protein
MVILVPVYPLVSKVSFGVELGYSDVCEEGRRLFEDLNNLFMVCSCPSVAAMITSTSTIY